MTKTDATRILALDLGTSSARALVLSAADAAPVPGALARYKISPTYATGGSATLDLHEYVEGLLGCLDELQQNGHLDGHRRDRAVLAVALDRCPRRPGCAR